MTMKDLEALGIKELLSEFRTDCEQALKEVIANAKNNLVNYNVNFADLHIVDVSAKIDEQLDTSLFCLIEEGNDHKFAMDVGLRLKDKWSDERGFYVEVNIEW